jgi:hypothetical protein
MAAALPVQLHHREAAALGLLEATSMEEQKSTMFSHGGGGPI